MILSLLFAAIHITIDAGKPLNSISPFMYGACIEDVNHEIYGGLYAQQLFGESFEEPDRNGDGVSGMWDAVGSAHFSLEGNAFNGAQCQKIEHGNGVAGVANRGLNRWGIAARQGASMEGRVYLHGDVKEAIVALQSANGSKTYASQRVPVGPQWTKTPFHLRPNADDPNARFAILIDKPGTLWVDQAVLMDGDRFHNLPCRGDIARAMQDEKLTFLRYGGSMVNASDYRWKHMIGDPDQRPPYHGTWYPFSTNGFGIFDFLNFCEAARFGAAFAINIEETPQDAADLADYLTAPISNPWGAKRTADGHPAPYHPDYIEIGNEEGLGHLDAPSMRHYAERFKLLSTAIHQRNPNLKLVCGAWWDANSSEMKTVFDAIDGVATAWDFHFWCDDPDSGHGIGRDLDRAESLFHQWNAKSNLKAVIFEENGNLHGYQRALGHATTLIATRSHGNFLIADCAANCLQALHQNDNGWDQGAIFYDTIHSWLMPPAIIDRLISDRNSETCVSGTSDGPLDVLATKSADGKTLTIELVNLADHVVPAEVTVNGLRVRKALAQSLTGTNSASEEAAIANQKVSVKNGVLSFDIPANSIARLTTE